MGSLVGIVTLAFAGIDGPLSADTKPCHNCKVSSNTSATFTVAAASDLSIQCEAFDCQEFCLQTNMMLASEHRLKCARFCCRYLVHSTKQFGPFCCGQCWGRETGILHGRSSHGDLSERQIAADSVPSATHGPSTYEIQMMHQVQENKDLHTHLCWNQMHSVQNRDQVCATWQGNVFSEDQPPKSAQLGSADATTSWSSSQDVTSTKSSSSSSHVPPCFNLVQICTAYQFRNLLHLQLHPCFHCTGTPTARLDQWPQPSPPKAKAVWTPDQNLHVLHMSSATSTKPSFVRDLTGTNMEGDHLATTCPDD